MDKRIIKTMAISSLMSILLLLVRICWSGRWSFVFLSWNLFLAWMPVFSVLLLNKVRNKPNSKLLTCMAFGSWLLFFPNSPYILTDMFHLHLRPDVPLWFDLILILSFAWNGLLLGFTSLFSIHSFLNRLFSERTTWCFIFLIMVLCGFGIYLGRYPRWNSWDIITNPFALAHDICYMLLHPLQYPRMVGVTVFFSVFLMVSYLTLNSFIKYINYERNETK